MATLVNTVAAPVRVSRFWLASAILMTLVIVAGFSTQLAMHRSSFAAPLYVHAHALLFFGWTALYLLQNILADRAGMSLHRRLGWLATAWVPAMVGMGIFVTVAMVRRGHAPFFFTPLYFLVMNPLSILTFAGLTTVAIVRRRETQWHRRLMFCGMAILTGPAFGRLLPMPFLIPFAGWAVFVPVILLPLAGVIRDWQQDKRVHPAWLWGIATILAMQVMMDVIARSPTGAALYRVATAGSPGANVPPSVYPPFPPL